MTPSYMNVKTRFLRDDERMMLSEEKQMPLVIEPDSQNDLTFLRHFLAANTSQLLTDLAKYGAILLRGFAVKDEADFENTILSIKVMRGIGEAFMSEQGRIPVGNLKYVLHTNAVYKTGGTLYLGGFHSENYYSADVPDYISFCCLRPSDSGGETGLVNTEQVYARLDENLKQKLEKKAFFVAKWPVAEVAQRYYITPQQVTDICKAFDLPLIGEGENKFVLMYKPNVFVHPLTKQKALQINFFELLPLNAELRKCFNDDYPGKTWFWHRLVWRLPAWVLKALEIAYMSVASLYYSPRESMAIMKAKWNVWRKASTLPPFDNQRVGSCFDAAEIKQLAKLMRAHYCSCLWQRGDILLVDNRKVAHAGMPGAGPRTIRAMICNPITMRYSAQQPGVLHTQDRETETVGYYMEKGDYKKERSVELMKE